MGWLNIIYVVYKIIVIVAVIHVILDNRQPAKTMAWTMVIYFVPVVGIVFYLFFGINTRRERYVSDRSMNQLTKHVRCWSLLNSRICNCPRSTSP